MEMSNLTGKLNEHDIKKNKNLLVHLVLGFMS